MTINVTTNDITNTTSASSAGIINANFAALKAGMLKALNQESGASNTMSSDIDLDSNDLLNVNTINGVDATTLVSVATNVAAAAASAVAAAASETAAAASATSASSSATSATASATSATASATSATASATAASASATAADVAKIEWQGAYNGGTSYEVNDAVSYTNSSYICILASTGNLPTNATYWEVLALKGADGAGAGDMLASTYDPTTIAGDAFDMDNMVEGTTTKILTATERTKLSGIETAADVTDEANVTTALDGATLSSATVASTDKVLVQDVDDSDNLKTVTAQSIADLSTATGGGPSAGTNAIIRTNATNVIEDITVYDHATTTDTSSTDTLDVGTDDGFANGDTVSFTTTGTLPTGLAIETTYYVINVAVGTLQVSTTFSGSAASIAHTSGSGTHTIYQSINGHSAGPITIESTFAVTVPFGSTWGVT